MVVPIIYPVLAQTVPPDLDKIPPVGHLNRSTNKNIVFTNPTVTL